MMQTRQWTIGIGAASALVFGVALAAKIWPQLDLVGVGSRAPAFRAVNLRSGRPSSLADYRGRVVLLNVWATWCPPCRVEMPSLERLHGKLAGPDFAVVAVSIDDGDASTLMAFVRVLGLGFALRLAVIVPPGRSVRQQPVGVTVTLSGKGSEILKLRSFPRMIRKTIPDTFSGSVWSIHLQPSDVSIPKGTDVQVAEIAPRDL